MMKSCLRCTPLLLSLTLSLSDVHAQNAPAPVESPVSPQASLALIETHPAVRVELVAAEPQVIDPVAIAFDEQLRMWVVEMSDYPNGPSGPEATPLSRIKILEDTDRDGFYETANVFADGLLFANGVQPWKRGVIATMAGQVAYLKDTDGDGRADLQETWYEGFAKENPQLRANHPTLGLDHQVSIANGLRGGTVISRRPDTENPQPISISGRDFRFDPRTGDYAAISGVGQFGLTFDDFGNRFVCSNRNPVRHVVLANEYLVRAPEIPIDSVVHDVAVPGEASRVHAINQPWTTSTLHAGQFTAACGVTIYRGTALPQEFFGNSMTCEPTGALVHREVLTAEGATFSGRPAREGVEFLASRDNWFRAVNLANGPDGALYVVDMYRAVIEHPQFMPTELKERPDLRLGDDRGRIYRVVAADAPTKEAAVPVPARLSHEALVEQLAHPDAWQRETAARLLIEQQATEQTARLRALSRSGTLPQARLHAYWLLQGLRTLEPTDVIAALQDPDPRVVRSGIRLSEPFLESDPQVLEVLRSLATTEDGGVAYQLALTLGLAETPWRQRALSELIARHISDPWLQRAVLLSGGRQPNALLQSAMTALQHSARGWATPGLSSLLASLGRLIGTQDRGSATRALQTVLNAPVEPAEASAAEAARVEFLVGLGNGLRRQRVALIALAENDDRARSTLAQLFETAADAVAGKSSTKTAPADLLRLLEFAPTELAVPTLQRAIVAPVDQSLSAPAVAVLATFSDAQIDEFLIGQFTTQTPSVRSAILAGLLGRTTSTARLLDAIEEGRIRPTEIPVTFSTRLLKHRDAELRKRAETVLAAQRPAARQDVLRTYAAALEMNGNPVNGKRVFVKNCTTCHRIDDQGVDVAPDIADSRTKTPAALLTAILDPNQAIDNNYFAYTIILNDGTQESGLIASETGSSLTIKQPEGKTLVISKSDIDLLQSTGLSLMPVGLEKNITVEEMADLISYIKNWRYLDGAVPIPTGER